MDYALTNFEEVVSNVGRKIDMLTWKIKQLEWMLFSENETFHSSKMISTMTSLAETYRKYDEILLLVATHKREQNAFTETLQLQVNLVKSKAETLRALITKGRTIEF